MNKRQLALAVCLGFAISGPACAQTNFTGGNPAYSESPVQLGGSAVILVQMTGYYHQMNLPPHYAQPIGLEEFFYVIEREPTWHVDRCEKWIRKVHDDEGAWTNTMPTYPYWEINIAPNAKRITVNGVQAFDEKDVQCWEAMDFGPPLY